ncbi:methyltransferase type 11 [Mycena filopes]|nr:methyltransferase type 11 [Mycena filopes]
MPARVHQVAKTGFGVGNELYDRRERCPTYATRLKQLLPSMSSSTIHMQSCFKRQLVSCRIGAGTGIFTRAFIAHPEWSCAFLELKAIEPSAGMRDVFSKTVVDEQGRVSISDGTFEQTHVEDGWADLVVVAQAFHWCPDFARASEEFGRILKPGGVLALIWNLEDRETAKWVAQVRDRIEQYEQGSPQYRLGMWRKAFETEAYQKAFDPPEEQTFGTPLQATLDIVVDRACKTLFAKSNELSVSFYANLPIEVKQVLKNADFYADAYSGVIDTLTGFALVASGQTCFVWQHAQAVKGTPTCYIFSCPHDHDRSNPPFHELVPYTSAREPGLILVSLSGEIRFWDSIGIGLAGGQNYSTTDLGLSADEVVTNLLRVDPQTYILSTSSGLLFRLILTSAGGKHHLTSHAFSRPSTGLSLSRLIPSFLSSTPSSSHHSPLTPEVGNISSIALGGRTLTGGRELWALVDTRVQRWEMKLEGWEEPLLDQEIAGVARSALRSAFGDSVERDNSQLDLELVDIAIDGEGKLVILVSYAGRDEPRLMAMDVGGGVRRIYALIRLSYLGEVFKVDGVQNVPYQSTSTSGAPVHPRIQVLLDGQLISVQFGDAVALCARDSDYRDRIELKSASDRTLGVGVVQNESALLILTAATMMKAQIDMENVLVFDSETGRANLIKSIMTQAIVYSSVPDNPLQFSFPPEVDEESLMQGAEQLSKAVLSSDPEVVRINPDLSAQLTSRKERLSWLIHFINDNAVLGRSRQQLATDSEKLYAGYQLWVQHNEVLASESVLNEAVESYMESIQEGHYEDIVRAFFRLRVGDMGSLLSQVTDVTAKLAQNGGRDLVELLPEANRVVLTVLTSALEYREYNLRVYGILLPMIDPWTSSPAVIDVVLGLFESTTKVLDSSTRAGVVLEQNTYTSSQLPELASVLFACIQERLDWLSSPTAGETPGVEQDNNELRQKFDFLRPEILETLRKHGHAITAFALAEKYRDFSSLAALCHQDEVYPSHKNPNALRIQNYIDRFKEDFTTELYRWYVQHGELRVMFSQDDMQSIYMDKFFASRPDSAISWIHDLGQRRYEAAAEALLAESETAPKLSTKHLMLSIGKLADLAHVQETNEIADDHVLDHFHNDLDFVSVHQRLLDEFKPVLDSLRARQSLDAQIDAIVKSEASRTAGSKGPDSSYIFKDLVRQLLQGSALSMEDTVDALTLKDNTTSNLPEARRMSAFRSVWRRIYIHDDWDAIRRTANVSDHQLNERFRATALYATLSVVLAMDSAPEGYDTSPDAALIKSRWPGLSSEQVGALLQDYMLECDQLGDLDLNDVYERIRELAAHALVWQ